MKTAIFIPTIFLLVLFSCANKVYAQDCILKDTILRVDFGTAAAIQDFNLNRLSGYKRITDDCPNDGMYTFATSTARCYSDHWYTLDEDHTPGDNNGRMLICNASPSTGLFFYATLAGLKPNTKYEISMWLLNLCKINNDCTSTLPDITIRLEKPDQGLIAEFRTGSIAQTTVAAWKRYFSLFSTPPDVNLVNVKFINNAPGGCGNDFAMDDITFRQCYQPEPLPVVKKQPVRIPPPVVVKNPVKEPVKESPALKKRHVAVTVIPSKNIPAQTNQVKAAPVNKVGLPDPIRTRENLLIKKLDVAAGELTIQLYDNGTIDGDTVSIYHNNELIVSRAGLSEKPITIKLTVDGADPHHELIMVAENLGSIPPNTSLMVVTSKGKREEVFISSTKQQNAKLVIDLN